MEEVADLIKRLINRIYDTGALLEGGDFTLSSGSTSRYYFDGKLLTLDPEGNFLVGKLMFELLRETGVAAVGGLTIGADPIAGAIARESYLAADPLAGFIVRESEKTHGRRRDIEGHLPTGSNLKVAIVDDVITLGGSIQKAIDKVKAHGCEVAKILTVVDRHEGGSGKLKEQGYDFSTILGLTSEGKPFVEYPGFRRMEAEDFLATVS